MALRAPLFGAGTEGGMDRTRGRYRMSSRLTIGALSLMAAALALTPPIMRQLDAQSQAGELVIRGGQVFTGDRLITADLRLRNGQIAEIGPKLAVPQGAQEVNASGLIALPGGVDPHVHVAGNWADDYTSGSAAALAGGITTIANFVPQRPDENPGVALDAAEKLIREQSIADVMLHTTIGDPATFTAAWFSALSDRGQPSIKIYTYRPVFDQNAAGFLRLFKAAGAAGVLPMIHAEDGPILTTTAEQMIAEGRGSLRYFADARPPLAEEVATQRAVAMSEATGVPIYLVHVSSTRALRVAQDAQRRGVAVFVETRPIYLHLTRDSYEGPDGPIYVSHPPLREKSDQDSLWAGLADGTIHTLASDHAPLSRERKMDPTQTVARQSPGMENIQVMLPMAYSEGVRTRRIDLKRFVAASSTNAAKLFGLYPRKGTIAVGSDADVVLWDPNARRTIRDEDILSGSRFSVFVGRAVTGWPRMTIRRGEIVYADGKVTGRAGTGQLLRRARFQKPTL
jgi:dihydropyrimidinase